MKHRTRETELACKSSKNLFESLNKKSKKNITQKKYLSTSMMLKNVEHYEGTNRNNKLKLSNLPRKITVNEVDIFDESKIANKF